MMKWFGYGTLLLAASSFGNDFDLPVIDDKDLVEKLHDPRTIWYDGRSHPRRFQFAGASPNTEPWFVPRTATLNGSDFGGGHGNSEFPWKHPAGTDFASNVDTAKFVWLPPGGQIAVYRQRVTKEAQPGWVNAVRWMYPIDTVIGEILLQRAPRDAGTKAWVVWEIRTRTRERDDWAVDILRPKSLSAAPVSGREVQTIRDKLHPVAAFPETSGEANILKPMSHPEVARLLASEFESVLGTEDHYTQYSQDFHLVPKGYFGSVIGTDRESCRRCHEHTGRSVDNFQTQLERDWYGLLSGNGNGIISHDPFAPTSRIELDPELVQKGLVAIYNRNAHPLHTTLKKFDPPATSRPVRGLRIVTNRGFAPTNQVQPCAGGT